MNRCANPFPPVNNWGIALVMFCLALLFVFILTLYGHETKDSSCKYTQGSIVTIVMNEEAGMVTGCPGDKISVRLDDLREIKFYSFEIEGDIK